MSMYRVYGQVTPEYNASIYYRVLFPMSMMERLGLPVQCIFDWSSCDVSPRRRIEAFMESDFDVIYQSVSAGRLTLMDTAKKLKPMQDSEGALRWPPTMIVDTDDDLFNVHPLNLTFGVNGTKRPDGSPIEDGDVIGVEHPTEVPDDDFQARLNAKVPSPLPGAKIKVGEDTFIFSADGKWHLYVELWHDGVNCSFASNRNRAELWRSTLKAAHLVTCSTPRVAEYVKREAGPETPTFVAYNAINFEEYPMVELRDHPDEVRILWQGSATHHEDLWPLNAAIARIAKKYPQTKWVFWGAPYKWAGRNIPSDRLTMLPWLHFESYKPRLSTINHDINLAPLTPNAFNNCRSAIKWYESSAICKPAATLAQNTGAYADEIIEGETGMLFSTPEEFEEKLSALIEQETLRKQLASNAKDWVRSNRDSRPLITNLYKAWVEARENHKLTLPAPSLSLDSAPEDVPNALPAA